MRVHKPSKVEADPLHGLFETKVAGKDAIVEYESDSDLRDTEQVPLLEEGGIEAFIRREVLPYTPDAWVKEEATRIGYEVSFTRHLLQAEAARSKRFARTSWPSKKMPRDCWMLKGDGA